ncbi:hypothetical protein B0J14DRAFT_640085 [Halenospora varia]|nr:hypothetical protein B0J14DRAFT_640085 [Halenospora varia]
MAGNNSTAMEADTRYLGQRLGTEIVTIYVGNERTEFVVHKQLICETADYFSKAFTGAFVERDGVIHLPEERPETFALFVDWVYTGRIPCHHTQLHLENLFRLYVFAEKLCLNDPANKAIDQMVDLCRTVSPRISTRMVEYVYKNTFVDSPLRKFALYDWMYSMDKSGATGHLKPDHFQGPESAENLFKDVDFCKDYFARLSPVHPQTHKLAHPRALQWPPCDLHRHSPNEPCQAGGAVLSKPWVASAMPFLP